MHTHEITRNGSVVTVGARTLVARGFLAAGLSTTPSAVWTGTHYQMVWADARASTTSPCSSVSGSTGTASRSMSSDVR
ncbi:MAG: hypothetical protein U0169_22980 [Polyangiaceae bacterium]